MGTDGNTHINVDSTTGTVTLEFTDDKGDVTSVPDGVSVAFTSSDETTVTVANDANTPNQGNLSLLKAGTGITVTATPSGANAPSGQPFSPQSVTLDVDPGAAVDDRIKVTS
jgi:hypothetical protein